MTDRQTPSGLTKGVIFLGFIAAGLAGNYLNYSLFLSIDFLFGSIFAMLALQFFGLGYGVLAAALIASYTFVLWNHPYAIIIMTAEVVAVGGLMQRRKMRMLLADALFWLLLGMPMIFVFYHLVMGTPLSSAYVIMVKQAVNGIANVILARILFAGFASRLQSGQLSMGELIGNLLTAFLLFPALIMLAISSKTDFAETDQGIRSALQQKSLVVTDRLTDWVDSRTQVVLSLTELASTLSAQQMQDRLTQARASDMNFLRIGMRDTESVIVAYAPPVDESGQSNIGKKFPERPYITELKRTLKPMLAEVVMGRVDKPEPVVILLAPVLRQGQYAGYINSVLRLDQIRKQLEISAEGSTLLYSLIDSKGKLILSNRSDQKMMTPFVRSQGKLSPVEANIRQWVPVLPTNTSISDQWASSYYVAQSTVGDLGGWKVVLEQPVAPFQKALYDSYTTKLALLFAISLAALVLAELLSRRVTATLERLSVISHDLPRKLATDVAQIAWPKSGIIDTNHLIENFKTMAETLEKQMFEIRMINESLDQRVQERTQELLDSEARFRTVIEMTPDAIVLHRSGKLLFVNPAAIQMFGAKTAPELLDKPILELIHPDYHKLVLERVKAGTEQGIHALRLEEKYIKLDGTVFEAEVQGQPIVLLGQPAVLVTLRDITERKQSESKLQIAASVFSHAREGITITDASGTIIDVNDSFTRISGYAREEVLGQNPRILRSGRHDSAFYVAMWGSLIANGFWSGEIWNRRKDGEVFPEQLTICAMRDPQGVNLGYIALFSDITERKRAQDALRQSEEKHRQLIDNSHDIIFTLDVDGVFTFVSPSWNSHLGHPLDQVLGHSFMPFVHPDDLGTCMTALQNLFATGQRLQDIEYRVKHQNGTWRWFSANASPQRDINDRVFAFEGNAKDITEHKTLEARVHHMAYFDALTGLPNRRMLHDRLGQAMATSKRSGLYGALMFLDLDNFKSLNDLHGHAMGDLLLIEVARRLTECLREMDTVARFGGDEFVVMLSELDAHKAVSTEQARGVAEKIRASLAVPYFLTESQPGQQNKTLQHHCSVSIGVVVFVDHEISTSDLLRWADEAMYQAKDAGRNAIRFYVPLMPRLVGEAGDHKP